MSDKIGVLKSASQYFFDRMDHTNPDDENGIAVTAIEWAIDQLRWRRVEDELPETSDWYLTVDPLFRGGDGLDIAYWSAWIGDWIDSEDYQQRHVLADEIKWWRPIELPETE